jgi:uncharacterized delta-60 repeat protein
MVSRRRGWRLASVLAVAVGAGSVAAASLAAPGDLDSKFGKAGKLEFAFAGGEESMNDIVVLPDGRAFVAGTTTDIGEDFFPEIAIALLRPSGRFDTSFGGDGKVTFAFPDSSDRETGLAVQSDGKVVVTAATAFGSPAGLQLARVNTNGSPDTTFSGDGFEITDLPGMTGEFAGDVVTLADGRLLVGGSAVVNGTRKWVLARYTSSGALDQSFSNDGFETIGFPGEGTIARLVVQVDGRIVAGGNSGDRLAMARYMPGGGLDQSFSGDGQLSGDAGSAVTGLALDGAGRIVTSNAAASSFSITRFTPAGEPDPEFSGDGAQQVKFPNGPSTSHDLVALADGDIAVVGSARHTAKSDQDDFAIAKLTPGGELERSFSGDGRATTDFFCGLVEEASAIAVQDGRLLVSGSCQFPYVGGRFEDGNSAFARYLDEPGKHDADADGVLDKRDRCPEAFGPRGGNGCAKVERDFIQVRGAKGKVVGRLASRAIDCVLGERITLVRISGGGSRVVDTVRSPRGAFKFKVKRRQAYKVRTGRQLERRAGFCAEAVSKTVKTKR